MLPTKAEGKNAAGRFIFGFMRRLTCERVCLCINLMVRD